MKMVANAGTGQRPALGPNDKCWCGSGTKYKRCHRDADAEEERRARAASAERRLSPGTISPRRPVPPHIVRPDYAETGTPAPFRLSEVKDADRIARMRRACRAAAEVLAETAAAIRPGVTTDELDAIAHEACLRRGAYPSPLNYRGFPKSLCTSVNEVICHGIPDSRPLLDGDIVNLDVTVYLDGMHGDTNATFLVGDVDPESRRLVEVTRACLMKGIEAVRPGAPLREIGRAIERHAGTSGFSVVRAYCGHGIGESFHTSLQIPHYDEPHATTEILPGMTFTVEPMINRGTWRHKVWPDGWTAVTADGERSAQFEHTILVTERGAEILTVV
jgi:methionyl aminopeptidase